MSLFEEIKRLEDAKLNVYADSKGIPTIGVGYNLQERIVLEAVLNQFGYSINSIGIDEFKTLTDELLDIFDKTWSPQNTPTYTIQVNQILSDYAIKVTDGSSPRITFTFENTTTDMEPVFDTAIAFIEDDVVNRLQVKLGTSQQNAQNLFDGLSDAHKASLLSLAYNGGPAIIGNNLSKAMDEGDWASAYFEIAYASNWNDTDGNGQGDTRIYGIHLRRLDEARSFSENLDTAQSKALLDKLSSEKNRITGYLNELKSSLESGGYAEVAIAKRVALYDDLNNMARDLRNELGSSGVNPPFTTPIRNTWTRKKCPKFE